MDITYTIHYILNWQANDMNRHEDITTRSAEFVFDCKKKGGHLQSHAHPQPPALLTCILFCEAFTTKLLSLVELSLVYQQGSLFPLIREFNLIKKNPPPYYRAGTIVSPLPKRLQV